MSILVIIETWLGIIRVQDYMMNRKNKKHHIKLAADQSGKIKMVFEVVGLSALILAMSQKDVQYWIYWVWCLSLIIAIPFAVKSLINKYHRR
jgi:phosphatidylglycerophosphate synthase